MLKKVCGGLDVSKEIEILKMIREAECAHLLELVWMLVDNKQLGIFPVSRAINFQQPANIAYKVVEGMVDGLQYPHKQGIIHRGI